MTAREKKLPPQKKKPRPHNPHATRETVESIAVAVILAFLFRSFVAEAFVIPTGSMAPTLYGRNRDVTCEKCQYRYAAGASSESISQRRLREDDDDERFRPQILVTSTTCPVCRYEMELDPEHFPNQRSFSGDRILVSKFSYALTDPQRWDVIVFKFPGNAKQNYIKRLIGLPGELLEIRYGNIYSSPLLFHATEEQLGSYVSGRNLDLVGLFELAGIQLSADYKATQFYLNSKVVAEQIDDGDQSFIFWVSPDEQGARIYRSDFQIARKPPHKLRAMLQIVDDTDHIPAELTQANWPSRWQDWSGGGGWEAEPGHFRTRGAASSATWLRYRHLIPTSSDWSTINRTGLMPADVPNRRGRLICDYYAYNDVRLGPGNIAPNGPPVNWANDLAMECELEIVGSGGVVLFDLVKGGAHYTVQIDVATGGAELSITDGEDGFDNGESVARTRTATT
ncbi:MAG: signal peptidase I, partial [Pirellulaceae bacterium]|nr:signal peptidase I [Pirellulaceae bacterium]